MTQPNLPSESDRTDYQLPARASNPGRNVIAAILICLAIGILFYQRMGGISLFHKHDSIPWQADFTAALAKSKETGKPVLVDFGASWCPACEQMKHASWPDAKVQQIVKDKYIPVFLDVDQKSAGEVSQHYAVEYLPTVLVLDGNGKVLQRAEYLDAGELADFLVDGKVPARQPS